MTFIEGGKPAPITHEERLSKEVMALTQDKIAHGGVGNGRLAGFDELGKAIILHEPPKLTEAVGKVVDPLFVDRSNFAPVPWSS